MKGLMASCVSRYFTDFRKNCAQNQKSPTRSVLPGHHSVRNPRWHRSKFWPAVAAVTIESMGVTPPWLLLTLLNLWGRDGLLMLIRRSRTQRQLASLKPLQSVVLPQYYHAQCVMFMKKVANNNDHFSFVSLQFAEIIMYIVSMSTEWLSWVCEIIHIPPYSWLTQRRLTNYSLYYIEHAEKRTWIEWEEYSQIS